MPQPLILIDQAGLPPGAPGVSRRDVVVGIPVNVSDFAHAVGTFLWELSVPPLSLATLDNPTSPTPIFTPDVPGAYLLFVSVDGVDFSFTVDADNNKLSSMGGCGVELPNGTLSHGVGESRQFSPLGWGARFDELFPFFDTLRAGGGSVGGIAFRPGSGETGPVLFDVWDDMFAAIEAIRLLVGGPIPITVYVDNSALAPNTLIGIPLTAHGTYDFQGIKLTSLNDFAEIDFEDGTSIINLRDIERIAIYNSNLLTPLETLAGNFPLIKMTDGASVQTINGGFGFWDASGLVIGFRVDVLNLSVLAFDIPNRGYKTGPIVVGIPAGAILQIIVIDANSVQFTLGDNSRPLLFQGDPGSLLIAVVDDLSVYPDGFGNYAGTVLGPFVTHRALLPPIPYGLVPATAPVSAAFGSMLRLDASVAPIAQNLPRISNAKKPNAGTLVTVLEHGGGLVTLGHQAGDSIQGDVGGKLLVPPKGALLVEGDGLADWRAVGQYNPNQVPGVTYTYQPGGTGKGPVVFNDWQELEAAKEANRALSGGDGQFQALLLIDDSFVTPAVIPANNGDPAYNFEGVLVHGGNKGFNSRLDFADGCSIVGLRRVGNNIGIRSLTTGSLETLGPLPGGAIFIEIGFDSFINQAAGGRFFDGAGMSPGDFIFVYLELFATLNFNFGGGSGSDAVVFLPTGTFAQLQAGVGASIPLSGYEGAVGSAVFIGTPTTLSLPATVPVGFLGTVVYPATVEAPPSFVPKPYLAAPAAATQAAEQGAWHRYDTSGGPIVHTLNQLIGGNAYKRPGIPNIVSEESGSAGLTVQPPAGMTLDGGTSPISIPPGGSVWFVNNGQTEWHTISVHDPGHTIVPQVTYQPGGTGVGPSVFSDWTALVAQIALIRAANGNAQIDLVFDNLISSPIDIPVGGPYDMTRVTWTSIDPEGLTGLGVPVNIPEGVTFTGLRYFAGNLAVTGQATATPIDTSLTAADRTINVKGSTTLQNTGAVSIWSGTGLVGGNTVVVIVEERGALGFLAVPTTPIIDTLLGNINALAFDSGLVRENSLAGTNFVAAPSGDACRIRANQAGITGTITQSLAQFTRYVIDAALVAATPNALAIQRLARYDTTAGNIVANLPAATGGDSFRGQLVTVKNETGGNNVNVTPDGTDTIDGVAALSAVLPGTAAQFVTNGLTNWTRI